MEAFGMTVSDQMYEQMRGRMWLAPYQTAVGVADLLADHGASPSPASCFSCSTWRWAAARRSSSCSPCSCHAGVISALQQLFTGPLNYFRGAVTSATNLAVLLPMVDPKSFVGRMLAMTDLFLIWYLLVLAIGLAVLYRRKTQPIALALYGVYAAGVVVIAAVWSRAGGGMSRKKKILIGAGVVVVLGAVAFANFKFKRTEGITVNTEAVQKRKLEAIVSASGQDPAEAVREHQRGHERTGHGAGGQRRRPRHEGAVPAADRPAQPAHARDERRGVARRGAVERRAAEAGAGELAHAAQAGAGQLQAPAGAVEGRADHARAVRARRKRAPRPRAGSARPGTERPHAADADGSGSGDARERQDRPEQGAHRSRRSTASSRAATSSRAKRRWSAR